MRMFFVRAHATVGNKIIFEGEQPIGYYQRLGVTVRDQSDVVKFVREFIEQDTGGRLLEIDEFEVADLAKEEIYPECICGDRFSLGVWYCSGKAFYGDDDDHREDVDENQ